MACWPVLGKAYAKFYCAGANFLFGSFGSKGIVQFSNLEDARYDIMVRLYNVGHRVQSGAISSVGLSHSSRCDGYMYPVFLAALVAATPMSVKRKLWALLWGLILIHCFIALRLAVHIIEIFSREPLRLFAISSFWDGWFYKAYQQFVVNITFGFVVAIFIWILVAFRREDWSKIVMQKEREK